MSTVRLYRNVAVLVFAFCLLLRTSFVRAEEPSYTITLPDKQTLRVTVSLTRTPNGGTYARVYSVPPTVVKYDMTLDCGETIRESGAPAECLVAFGPKATPLTVYLQAKRTDLNPDYGQATFSFLSPERSETTPYSGRLIELTSGIFSLGRQYDWKRKGEQTFLCLVDRGVATPQFLPLKLKAAGGEVISLSDAPKVRARKLRYECEFPYTPEEYRKGIIYIGPSGEVLRCDSNLFGMAFQAKAPAKKTLDGYGLDLPLAIPKDWEFKERLRAGGEREITLDVLGGYNYATIRLNAQGQLKSMETPWIGRPFTAEVVGKQVAWKLEASAALSEKKTDTPVWFLPHWFLTEVWETGNSPFAQMGVREKRMGYYFPLFYGDMEGSPLTIERLDDYRAAKPDGTAFTLFRYLVTTKVAYEIYTDGKRLVAMIASDGTKSVQVGWEKVGDLLTPPPAPAPTPTDPAQIGREEIKRRVLALTLAP